MKINPPPLSLTDSVPIPIAKKIWIACERVKKVIDDYKPIAVFGLFSGGHDSFSSTYIASRCEGFTAAVHINTGIGIEATRQFVRTTCAERGWPLQEYHAKENCRADGTSDPQNYEKLVMKHGFPGPGGHDMMYVRLKSRALARLERDYGATARGKNKRLILYISGCRQQESQRRMGNTALLRVMGRTIWLNPCLDWTKLDTSLCLRYAHQPRNPIVDLIHKSGECLCGAFAKPGELEELAMWPETRPAYDYIIALQAEVKQIHGWGWGQRPPKKSEKACKLDLSMQQLCWSCFK